MVVFDKQNKFYRSVKHMRWNFGSSGVNGNFATNINTAKISLMAC